jgi:hypothetical protein
MFNISVAELNNIQWRALLNAVEVEVEIILGLTVGQSVSISWCHAHSGTCDQNYFLSERFCLKVAVLFLWGTLSLTRGWVCGLQCNHQWSESLRIRNYTLLSHLRLPQIQEPASRIQILQEQGGAVISRGTGFPLCHLLGLAGLQWRYSNPLPNGIKGSNVTSGLINEKKKKKLLQAK